MWFPCAPLNSQAHIFELLILVCTHQLYIFICYVGAIITALVIDSLHIVIGPALENIFIANIHV